LRDQDQQQNNNGFFQSSNQEVQWIGQGRRHPGVLIHHYTQVSEYHHVDSDWQKENQQLSQPGLTQQ
jgi:hypothetical protein